MDCEQQLTYSLAHLYGSSARMFGLAQVSISKGILNVRDTDDRIGFSKFETSHLGLPLSHVSETKRLGIGLHPRRAVMWSFHNFWAFAHVSSGKHAKKIQGRYWTSLNSRNWPSRSNERSPVALAETKSAQHHSQYITRVSHAYVIDAITSFADATCRLHSRRHLS